MCLESAEFEEAERFLDAPAVECDLCHDSMRAEGQMFFRKKPVEFQIMSGEIQTFKLGIQDFLMIFIFYLFLGHFTSSGTCQQCEAWLCSHPQQLPLTWSQFLSAINP